MSEEQATARITLGGIHYEHDPTMTAFKAIWFAGAMHRAGLSEVRMHRGETTELFAHRILGELCQEPERVFELLGGLIVPAGLVWSPEVAKITAQKLKSIGPDDFPIFNVLVAEMLIGFFEHGLTFITTSPSSSHGDEGKPFPHSETAAHETSAASARSSVSSPDTTRGAPPRSSSNGQSARSSLPLRLVAGVRRWTRGGSPS